MELLARERGARPDAARRLLTLAIGLGSSPATVADLGTWTVHGLTSAHAALLRLPRRFGLRGAIAPAALSAAAPRGLACGLPWRPICCSIPRRLLPLWVAALALWLRGRTDAPGDRHKGAVAGNDGRDGDGRHRHGASPCGDQPRASTAPARSRSAGQRGPSGSQRAHAVESLAALGNGDVFDAASGRARCCTPSCAGTATSPSSSRCRQLDSVLLSASSPRPW